MAVHKEDSLLAVSAVWGQRVPIPVPHLPVPPAADPASNAAAAGMADWPALHAAMAAERGVQAAQLVTGACQTDTVLNVADNTNAAEITATA